MLLYVRRGSYSDRFVRAESLTESGKSLHVVDVHDGKKFCLLLRQFRTLTGAERLAVSGGLPRAPAPVASEPVAFARAINEAESPNAFDAIGEPENTPKVIKLSTKAPCAGVVAKCALEIFKRGGAEFTLEDWVRIFSELSISSDEED